MKRALTLVVFALFLLPVRVAAQDPCFIVPVELRGPLDTARFEALGVASEARVRLAAGESRTILLPFGGGSVASLEPSEAAAALQVSSKPPSGTIVVRHAEASGPSAAPRGLGRRGRPPVAPDRPRPDGARLMLLLAGAVVLIGLRRRPRIAAATGVVTAGSLWLLPAVPLVGNELRGIDGDLARGRWLEVRSAMDRLELPGGGPGWFEVRGGKVGTWSIDEVGRRALEARGAELHFASEPAVRPLDPATGQPVHSLTELWLRSADGVWRAHADWPSGAAFPPVRADSVGGPPGWLASGLPQGVGILVARPTGPGAPDWLRISGWTAPESHERH